jgi:hypothetical protein
MTDDDEDYRIIDYQWVPKVSEVDMAHRWLPEQAAAIRETRQRVVEQLGAASWQRLAARKQQLTSDRRLLRYLLKNKMDPDAAAEAFVATVHWRTANGLEAMHDRIIAGNLNPVTVPDGERIIKLLPQIPCCFNKTDHKGNPLSVEYYG